MSRKKKNPAIANSAPQPVKTAGSILPGDAIASKKAAVLGAQNRNYRPLTVIVICIVLTAGGFFFIRQRINAGTGAAPAAQALLPSAAATDEFIYPAALFADGNARHYEYKGPAGTIKYFILKSSDGVIRAAFDACDVCWRAGKGYYQVGDRMICRNCGQKFASIRVNEVKGGCNPSPLTRSIKGDKVVIRINDILEGQPYFNFNGRI